MSGNAETAVKGLALLICEKRVRNPNDLAINRQPDLQHGIAQVSLTVNKTIPASQLNFPTTLRKNNFLSWFAIPIHVETNI
jgi:hypothetical protein